MSLPPTVIDEQARGKRHKALCPGGAEDHEALCPGGAEDSRGSARSVEDVSLIELDLVGAEDAQEF